MNRSCHIALVLGLAVALGAGCSKTSQNREARVKYNEALALFAKKDWNKAAEAFLAARDKAGPDPELRYRAAFNLGLTKANQADAVSKQEPEKAIELLRSAGDWFFDALSKKPNDKEARANLEAVQRRAEVLADKINQGKNTLAAKIDLLIQNQRALLEKVRQLMSQVAAAGAKADPVAFEAPFRALAVRERELMSDGTNASNLAAEQRSKLENVPKDKRDNENKAKIYQLKSFDKYMTQARSAMAETRRLLRRLQGDTAHKRADAALTALKRAHAQLQLPDKILRAIMADETVLFQHTQGLAATSRGLLKDKAGKPVKTPPWLSAPLLAGRQQDLVTRLDEVLSHLLAIAAAPDKPPEPKADAKAPAGKAAPKPPSAEQLAQRKQFIESSRNALSHVQTALAKMKSAKEHLAATEAKLADSLEDMAKVLESLKLALEQFAGMRALIELSYADQGKVVQVLSPPAKDPKKQHPLLSKLKPEDRTKLATTLVDYNVDRLKRLEPMLTQALKAAEKKAGSVPTPDPGKKLDPKDPKNAQAEQAKAEVAKLTKAQALRGEAAELLAKLKTALAPAKKKPAKKPAAKTDDADTPLALAKQGRDKLAELRKLFFNLIEHLKELVRAQSETMDKTVRAHQAMDKQRLSLLGPLAEFQDGHAKMAQAINKALGEQADQLAKSMKKPERDYGKKVSEAAAEVTSATGKMTDATANLKDAREKLKTSSYDLKPTLAEQRQAITHLTRALELLQRKNKKKKKNQNKDMSQRQAQSRLQKARDDEAKRRRRRTRGGKREPVEKDW